MSDPTFTTPPDAPSRASPSTFSSRTDAFLAWMVTFKDELSTAVSWFSSTAATVSTDAATTTAAKDAAIAAANAAPWVSAASYTALDVAISPVDYQPYRAKTTHSGLTTDPSLDATNWTQQFVVPDTASQAQAETGTDNTTRMTPLRTAQAITATSKSLLGIIQDEKAAGVNAGGSSSGTTTRVINTVDYDPGGIITLSANTFTVSRDCHVIFSAVGLVAGNHKAWIARDSDGAQIVIGTAERGNTSDFMTSRSWGAGKILAGVTYRLDHYRTTGYGSFGLGQAVGGSTGVEIYCQVQFWS
jgi:hypothetical protein